MKFTTLLSIGLLSLPTTLLAQTGQVVGPNGTSTLGTPTAWIPDVQNGASAQVTTTNPCGTVTVGPNGACGDGYGNVGSGSLEMRLQGNNQVLGTTEWAFWYHWASGSTDTRLASSFGTISQLSSLSFDWFRKSNEYSMNTSLTSDWADKTPVMRLRLWETAADGSQFESELVWEGWYNQCDLNYGPVAPANCNDNSTPLDTWVRQDGMENGRFWYLRPPGAGVGDGTFLDQGDCTFATVNAWNAAAAGSTIAELLGGSSRPKCLDANAQVLGLAVGIGSRWPHEYVGFVDNVRMGFTGQDGYAVNANFDFVPVPEPSSIALLGLGIAGLAAARRRRMKR